MKMKARVWKWQREASPHFAIFRFIGIWRDMETVDQLLQGKLSLLLRWDLSASTSLCLQHEPYSAIFISVTRGRRWRQRHRKTRFLFGSTSPMLSNANPLATTTVMPRKTSLENKHWRNCDYFTLILSCLNYTTLAKYASVRICKERRWSIKNRKRDLPLFAQFVIKTANVVISRCYFVENRT